MIREIIYEYWKAELPSARRRDFNFAVAGLDFINDVVGIRRAGKTYLLFSLIRYLTEVRKVDKRATLYINFENRRLYPPKEEFLTEIVEFVYAEGLLERFKKLYLFLDEIQNIQGWQRWIRSIYDEFKGRIKIFVSGSNQKLLEKEYARLLTGRHLSIRVYPLSFREYLEFHDIPLDPRGALTERERSIVKKQLKNYVQFGGFPEVALSSQKEEILQQYFHDIVTRDIMFREKIRKNLSLMEELGIYLVNNVATLVSFRKLANFFSSRGTRISVPTLQSYFRLFEDAFLFFAARIFSYKIKDQMQHPMKLYCIDTGLINALSVTFSKNLGRLYENVVAVELKRRKLDSYYWKDAQGREVDFVVKKGLEVSQLIQVSLNVESVETKKREITSLFKAAEELSCRNLLIITEENEMEEKHLGRKISYVPLWKWLTGSRHTTGQSQQDKGWGPGTPEKLL